MSEHSGQGIHDVTAGSFHDDISGEVGRQSSAGCQNIVKMSSVRHDSAAYRTKVNKPLLRIRNDPAESVDQFDTVITAIPQFTFTGYLFAILHFEGFDPGDIGKACDYAVTVLSRNPSARHTHRTSGVPPIQAACTDRHVPTYTLRFSSSKYLPFPDIIYTYLS